MNATPNIWLSFPEAEDIPAEESDMDREPREQPCQDNDLAPFKLNYVPTLTENIRRDIQFK